MRKMATNLQRPLRQEALPKLDLRVLEGQTLQILRSVAADNNLNGTSAQHKTEKNVATHLNPEFAARKLALV